MTSFLIGMAWKSLVVAGAALLLLRLVRTSPPAARAALLRFAALLLLALPLLALLLPTIEIAVPLAETPAAMSATTSEAPVGQLSSTAVATIAAPVPTAQVAAAPAAAELVAFFYLAGVLVLLVWLAFGLARLAAWTRNAREPDCPHWIGSFSRVRARSVSKRGARLLVSNQVAAPVSWGWPTAAILIDRASLARPDDATAVLEHEMAHVDRGDWVALILVRLAVALFWFNPLVWRLQREFILCTEEAADARAIRLVEPADYAQMLLGYALKGRNRALPANPVASHPIAARIQAILSRRAESGRQGWRIAAAMVACLAVAAPVAALSLQPDEPPLPPAAPHAPKAPLAPAVPTVPGVPDAPAPLAPPAAPAILAAVQPVDVPAIPEPPALNLERVDMDRTIREAMESSRAAAQEAREEAKRAMAEVEKIDVQAIQASALRAASEGMEHGAVGLEQGAREMAESARRLRTDPEYRRRARTEWAPHGRERSEAEVLEMARHMEQGAARMMEGAREMRRKADEMRDRRH